MTEPAIAELVGKVRLSAGCQEERVKVAKNGEEEGEKKGEADVATDL